MKTLKEINDLVAYAKKATERFVSGEAKFKKGLVKATNHDDVIIKTTLDILEAEILKLNAQLREKTDNKIVYEDGSHAVLVSNEGIEIRRNGNVRWLDWGKFVENYFKKLEVLKAVGSLSCQYRNNADDLGL